MVASINEGYNFTAFYSHNFFVYLKEYEIYINIFMTILFWPCFLNPKLYTLLFVNVCLCNVCMFFLYVDIKLCCPSVHFKYKYSAIE